MIAKTINISDETRFAQLSANTDRRMHFQLGPLQPDSQEIEGDSMNECPRDEELEIYGLLVARVVEKDTNKHECPYCEEPEKYGLLPAELVEIDTDDRPRLDYGNRRFVSSVVHKEIAGLSRLFAGVRCHLDPFHRERFVEDQGLESRYEDKGGEA